MSKRRGHTQMQWEAKFFRCGCACFYCNEPLLLSRATKDHRLPSCRGGSDVIDNIVPACFLCNLKKGDKTDKEFFALYPRFSTVSENRTALDEPKNYPTSHPLSTGGYRSYEFVDNPKLLSELRREETNTSWAWRNPA